MSRNRGGYDPSAAHADEDFSASAMGSYVTKPERGGTRNVTVDPARQAAILDACVLTADRWLARRMAATGRSNGPDLDRVRAWRWAWMARRVQLRERYGL